MKKKEEILNIASKNGGYITTKELTKYNINSRFLTSLVTLTNIKSLVVISGDILLLAI